MSITSVVNVPVLIKGFLVFVQYIWEKKRSCTLSLTENGALDIAFADSPTEVYMHTFI